MAIFGTLDEFTLPEMLMMLEKRSGCLRLWGLPQNDQCDIFINQGIIIDLRYNNHSADDIFELRDDIIKLMKTRQGNFEFNRLPQTNLAGEFTVPVRRLLINASHAIDEMEMYRDKFPHPQTRFERVSPLDAWSDQELFRFWERSYDLLERGISAYELSEALELELERIQLYFYKLRSLGNIRPTQAFHARASSGHPLHANQPPAQSKQPAHALPFALADVLLIDDQDTNHTTHTADANSKPAQERLQERPTAPAPPPPQEGNPDTDNNLIQRMLRALSFGRKS